jgi:hypothetical protein
LDGSLLVTLAFLENGQQNIKCGHTMAAILLSYI